MSFILFDFEFNSTKNKTKNINLNEIIEIGAVKLNSDFEEISSFSEFIKPKFGKKLNRYVKSLTHLRESDLEDANSFKKVMSAFKKWCRSKEKTVFLSWSDTDIYVLIQNYIQILGKNDVKFIKNYVDLQKYISNFLKRENNNQIGLESAARHYDIDTSQMHLHRARDDSRLCAKLLKKSYNKEVFDSLVKHPSKGEFYKRLLFKPYYITDITNPLLDKKTFDILCPSCGGDGGELRKIKPRPPGFSTVRKCNKCGAKHLITAKFKKTYDSVIVSKKIITLP